MFIGSDETLLQQDKQEHGKVQSHVESKKGKVSAEMRKLKKRAEVKTEV